MDSLFYLFLGYTVVWVLIFFYTLRLGKRQAKVAEELELLKKSFKGKM